MFLYVPIKACQKKKIGLVHNKYCLIFAHWTTNKLNIHSLQKKLSQNIITSQRPTYCGTVRRQGGRKFLWSPKLICPKLNSRMLTLYMDSMRTVLNPPPQIKNENNNPRPPNTLPFDANWDGLPPTFCVQPFFKGTWPTDDEAGGAWWRLMLARWLVHCS